MVGLLFSMPVANRNSGVLVTLRLGAARRMVSRDGVGFIVHLLEPERQDQSAQKDERLSNRFYRLRENLSHRDQARLDRDEGAWLMARRQCGGNRACTVKALSSCVGNRAGDDKAARCRGMLLKLSR